MADQVIIGISNQISSSTQIILLKEVTISHLDEGGDSSKPEILELDKNDYLRITADGADFTIQLDENFFIPSGEIKVPNYNSVLVCVKDNDIPKEGIAIPYRCSICKILPTDAQKKIIVKHAGETVDVRLGRLLNKVQQLEDIIQERIHKK